MRLLVSILFVLNFVKGSISSAQFKPVPYSDITKLSLCANDVYPNCLILKRDASLEIRVSYEMQTEKKLNAKEFEQKLRAILEKLKPSSDKDCSHHFLLTITHDQKEERRRICRGDYTDKEWREWHPFFF